MMTADLSDPTIFFKAFCFFESLFMLPLTGLLLPNFIACYAIYSLIAAAISFHMLVKAEKEDMRLKVASKYMAEMRNHNTVRLSKQRRLASTLSLSSPMIGSPCSHDSTTSNTSNTSHTSLASLSILDAVLAAGASSTQDITELVVTVSNSIYMDKTAQELAGSTLKTLFNDPVYFFDSLLSKRRTILALATLSLWGSRSFLVMLVGANQVRKGMILLSVTLPSIHVQYMLL